MVSKVGWGGAGITSIKGLQQNFPRLHKCLVLLASYLNDNVGTLGSFNASDYFEHYEVFGFSWVVDYTNSFVNATFGSWKKSC